MVGLTDDERCLIYNLRIEKNWGSKRVMEMFPDKLWNKNSIDRLIRKIDRDGSTRRKPGSGRPKSVRTAENIALVEEMICSQESKPHSHKTPREIARETGISHSSVRRIVKKDLNLKVYKRVIGQNLNDNCRVKRTERCQQLLQRFPNERSVRQIWFTDEKTFTV